MRKIILLLLVFLLCACSQKESKVAVQTNAQLVMSSKSLTHNELVENAKAETGEFVVYGTSSRIENASVSFTELYAIEVDAANVKDNEIYTKVDAEIAGNVEGADMILTQNGPEVLNRIAAGHFINFIPASVREYIAEDDLLPLVHQYNNKLFFYNNVTNQKSISNIWQLTDAEYKNRIFFKSPELEKVNMNFLVMLTSEKWVYELSKAYELYYGKTIDVGEFKNAGYMFIATFLENCSFEVSSDTKISEEVSKQEANDAVGLFVYNKLRSSSVIADNLTIVAYEEYEKDALPFAGFMYPLYATILKTTDRPYTAMLFIEHIMREEGFAPWNKDVGAYSGNTDIHINTGDRELDFWKSCLIMEEPTYIGEVYADVYAFVAPFLD